MASKYVPDEKYIELFGEARKGYEPERVDAYVSRLEAEYIKLSEQLKVLKEHLKNEKPEGQVDPEMQAKLDENSLRVQELEDENARLIRRSESVGNLEATVKELEVELADVKKERANATVVTDEERTKIIGETLLDAVSAASDIQEKARERADALIAEAQYKTIRITKAREDTITTLRTLTQLLNNTLQEAEDVVES